MDESCCLPTNCSKKGNFVHDYYPTLTCFQIQQKFSERHVDPTYLLRKSIYQVSPLMSTEDRPSCAICLDLFEDGDEIRVLDCDHCFHRRCIDTWLLGTLSDESTYTSVCPTCRRTVSSTPTSSSSKESLEVLECISEYGDFEISYAAFANVGEWLHTGEGCCRSPSPLGSLQTNPSSSSSSTSVTSPYAVLAHTPSDVTQDTSSSPEWCNSYSPLSMD